MEKDTTRLLNHFRQSSEEFNGRPPILSRAKAQSQAAFILKHLDIQEAIEVIDWAFTNWTRLQERLRLKTQTPQLSLFSSAYLNDILAFKDKGFISSEKNRFVEDSSPTLGWK